MLWLNVSNIAMITLRVLIIVAIDLLKHYVLNNRGYISKMHAKEIHIKNEMDNCYFDNLVQVKMLDTKNFLIDEKHYKDLVIYFTR